MVFRDLDLVGGDLELEVLDEFYSAAVLLVVSEGLAGFFGLLQELCVGLACGHVVGLDPVDLGHFVHQQLYFIIKCYRIQTNTQMRLLECSKFYYIRFSL